MLYVGVTHYGSKIALSRSTESEISVVGLQSDIRVTQLPIFVYELEPRRGIVQFDISRDFTRYLMHSDLIHLIQHVSS